MASDQDIMGPDHSEGSVVRPVNLSTYPEWSRLKLKAIILDMQFTGAAKMNITSGGPKCFVVFHGAGPFNPPRSWSKTKRFED